MKTVIYVDGFNLYYRLLKNSPHKWLNLKVLAEQVLNSTNVVSCVNFYTARVSGRISADGPARQQAYLSALASVPEIETYFGRFQVNKGYAKIVNAGSPAPVFLPIPNVMNMDPWPNVVRIVKIEEKGSDVNLGAHLVRDAFQNKFDVAAVITNDTDLVEPIRIVAQELGKPVGILSPVTKPAESLRKVASFVRHIRNTHLVSAQFPDSLPRIGKPDLVKPANWT